MLFHEGLKGDYNLGRLRVKVCKQGSNSLVIQWLGFTVLSRLGPWVQSLVGELKSHKLRDLAKLNIQTGVQRDKGLEMRINRGQAGSLLTEGAEWSWGWSVLQVTWGTLGVTPIVGTPQWKAGLVEAMVESDLAWGLGVSRGGASLLLCEDRSGLLREEEAQS